METPVSLGHSHSHELANSRELGEISAEIAQMERLIHETIDMLVMRLKKGLDVSEDERRIREMRSILEMLRASRKTILHATLVLHPTNAPARTEPIAEESQN